MRKKSMLTYGLLAAGAYLVYKHMQASAAPPAVAVVPAAPAVSGFGYFPSGADRPFTGRNQPFARATQGVRWY